MRTKKEFLDLADLARSLEGTLSSQAAKLCCDFGLVFGGESMGYKVCYWSGDSSDRYGITYELNFDGLCENAHPFRDEA